MSIGTPGSNVLDTGLLHQLRVVCALRPSALLNLTRDGTLKDLQIQVPPCCIRPIKGSFPCGALAEGSAGNCSFVVQVRSQA